MNTTVQNNTTPKTTSPRRSRFPGKESGSVSFNLTALGRQLLKEQAANASVSNGDYVEMLIRERAGMPPLRLPASLKQTGPKGGAKSFFFGKNRGTTTAVCVTPMAHRLLDEQVAASRMSRGDYIEYLLREKAGIIEESFKNFNLTAWQQQQVQMHQQQPEPQTSFAPPAPPQPVVESQPVLQQPVQQQPVQQPTPAPFPSRDWNSGY
ncbi:MAG: hypothetical protein K8F91_00630 [Candidatus Obscuribacterales bacterium]|nr:hypothetical protein [Candidatus Obscuribacterales bacterium]